MNSESARAEKPILTILILYGLFLVMIAVAFVVA